MKHLFFLIALCSGLSLCAQDSTHHYKFLTLREAVELGFANNPNVVQAGFNRDIAAVNVTQAKGNLIPQLNGNINHSINQGRSINPANNTYINSSLNGASYNLNSSVTLFNGFYLLNNLKRYQYYLHAGDMDLQQAKDKLMLDIILAYLQMLTNADLLEQARRQADVSRQQVERLQIMNREGAIKPSDLSDLRGQYAGDVLAYTSAQNALDQARYTLVNLMNVPYDANLMVERIGADQFDLTYGASVDSVYDQALNLALVKASDYRVKATDKEVKAAKGVLYPSLGIGGGFSTNYSSLATDNLNQKIGYGTQLKNNYGTSLSAGINIPILNNLRYRSNVALAKIDYRTAKFNAQTTRIQLKQTIEMDYFNMTASKDKYKSYVDQSDAYAESFHAAELRFNEGVGTSVDYLIAKNNLDRAKTNLIIGRYDFLLRTKILDYYQGKPLW